MGASFGKKDLLAQTVENRATQDQVFYLVVYTVPAKPTCNAETCMLSVSGSLKHICCLMVLEERHNHCHHNLVLKSAVDSICTSIKPRQTMELSCFACKSLYRALKLLVITGQKAIKNTTKAAEKAPRLWMKAGDPWILKST